MRPIRPLKMPDVLPADIDTERPRFADVDPTSLFVDERYQRNLSDRSVSLIRRIVAEWNWRAFKPPVVVQVGEDFHVVDGQHTAIAAASHPDVATIPIMLVVAETKEQRAGAFVRHNRDRIAITATQLHFAMVEAGDEDALTIQQVCERAGVQILKNPPGQGVFKEGDTMAVGALRSLVNRRFAVGARRVLQVCTAARLSPINADAIKAVEAILFDAEYAGAVKDEDLADTMRRLGATIEAEVATFSAAHRVPRWKALKVVWFKNTRKTRRGG